MKPEQIKAAEEAVSTLLLGAQLDHLQAYSLVLNLNFSKLPKVRDLPVDIWLSASGQAIFIEKAISIADGLGTIGNTDFFESREKLLGQLYRLIGKEIKEIDVDPSGTLELHFDEGVLVFAGDETDLEEVWSITTDTPDPYAKHDWAVTLTNERQLVTRKP